MKESLFQTNLVKELLRNGYFVLNISDRFNGGVPDIYCARDGVSHWYELKVVNKKKGAVDLSASTGSNYGFTKQQKITVFEMRKAGLDAWGLVYVSAHKVAVKVPPEDFERKLTVDELVADYEHFEVK